MSEIDKDELAHLLSVVGSSSPDDSIKKVEATSVLDYIMARGLAEGEAAVPVQVVYDDYVKRVVKPFSKIKFCTEFKKYFKLRRSINSRYYKLDPRSLDLPPDYSLFKVKYGMKKKSRAGHNEQQKENQKDDQDQSN